MHFNYLSVGFIYELSKRYDAFTVALSNIAHINFILKHIDYKWNWRSISCSKVITCNDILSHPELPWDYDSILYRNDINMELYLKLRNGCISNMLSRKLSMSKLITISDVLKFPRLPWDYRFMAVNPNITWKIINSYSYMPWDLSLIDRNDMSCPMEIKKYRTLYDVVVREINYLI